MRRNPKDDWTIEDLKTIADHFGIEYRSPGGSHVTFIAPGDTGRMTVPAHRPIKAVYIRDFIAMIDKLR